MSDEDLKAFIERTAAETRRHFDVAAEGLRSDIRLVAEGVLTANERIDRLDGRVERLEEKVDRLETTVEQFRVEVRAEFADVRSMIKFSHAELDRRIRTLEEGFADLQARVERLEASTH